MKNRIKVKILITFLFILFLSTNICRAQSEIKIIADKEIIQKDETIEIKVEINDTPIAAFTLEIYWDNSKLEYIQGPENSNHANNRILYTWVNSNGINAQRVDVGNFVFKGIEDGTANITVTGEFYNENGEEIELENSNFEIIIGETKAIEQITLEQNNVSPDNTNLSILRLNHEGISPEFQKDIKEYYFVTDKVIENLDVTAIPENSKATVTITGNRNLQMGNNIITITVEAEDKSNTSEYKIYVTRTANLELANASLETLAIRQAALNPEFDSNMTEYKVEIPNDVSKIELLAIPQREGATVTISGSEEMQIGHNKIEVTVLAEDGITSKKYYIDIYRRNEAEEIEEQEQKEIEAERLAVILEEQENNNKETFAEKGKKKTIVGVSILIVLIIILSSIIIYKRKKKV